VPPKDSILPPQDSILPQEIAKQTQMMTHHNMKDTDLHMQMLLLAKLGIKA
jgi:hypothetical protein